jgi:glycosyltransferase domain-containing protein
MGTGRREVAGGKTVSMITLLVPTLNRPDFVLRLLRYYNNLNFQGCICIGDSSQSDNLEKTKRAIQMYKGKINIIFRECPGMNGAQCIQQLLNLVSTPYAALLPDDDLLIPAALYRCVSYLKGHPEYTSAHGRAILVGLNSKGVYGKVAWVDRYRLPVIEADSASQRLLDHLSDYSVTLFGVHRIDSWRVMYQNVSLLKDATFALEFLPCCLSVIQGKIKELDCLYLLRQIHKQRYLLPEKKDWVADPEWQKSYKLFCDILAREIMLRDNIGLEQAQKTVEQAFSAYLEQRLAGYPPNRTGLFRLRQVAGIIPGAFEVWRSLQNVIFKQRVSAPLLKELLNPSSPYHQDFMPIYRALTRIPDNSDISL